MDLKETKIKEKFLKDFKLKNKNKTEKESKNVKIKRKKKLEFKVRLIFFVLSYAFVFLNKGIFKLFKQL